MLLTPRKILDRSIALGSSGKMPLLIKDLTKFVFDLMAFVFHKR